MSAQRMTGVISQNAQERRLFAMTEIPALRIPAILKKDVFLLKKAASTAMTAIPALWVICVLMENAKALKISVPAKQTMTALRMKLLKPAMEPCGALILNA
jgi:hypothetical protein